jgi:hypothetical protein
MIVVITNVVTKSFEGNDSGLISAFPEKETVRRMFTRLYVSRMSGFMISKLSARLK